jgi:predicted metal-dependent hydrolase
MVKRTNKKPSEISTDAGDFSYWLTRSSRRNSIGIHIKDSAVVCVCAPFYTRTEEIQAFVREKSGWIARNLQEARKRKNIFDQKKFDHGQEFFFLEISA